MEHFNSDLESQIRNPYQTENILGEFGENWTNEKISQNNENGSLLISEVL